MRVAIIGAGASGCMSALSIKDNDSSIIVDIYEKEDKILKKLAATGGGRCNLGNKVIDKKYFNNPGYIEEFINAYPVDAYLQYLNKSNFEVTNEGDLLYPYSKKATTLIDFFKDQLNKNKVNIYLNYDVTKCLFDGKIVINNKTYDKLIIAIGSKALVGKDIYNLIKKDFKINKTTPSLVGFKSKFIKNLKGVRQHAKVSLVRDNQVIMAEVGEIQFKEDGLSGICIMNLSSKFQPNDYVEINFLASVDQTELNRKLSTTKLTTHEFFKYYFDNKINELILKDIKNKFIKDLSKEELVVYLNKYNKFKIVVDGLYDFKFAQVCRGGVSLNEVDGFKSIKYPNVYFTGEILDIDAICGGYNLWFAFNSGMKVGKDCANNN